MPATQVNSILSDMMRAGGIRAAAVVSREGILIASELPAGVHAETFAAMAAIMFSAAETAAMQMNDAIPDRLIVETDEGKLVVAGAGDRMMLVTLIEAKAGLGHVIVEMSRAVTRIKEIFG
jgi:predicted regulator of Ras-like GTPase activity (Roadblock/LC7/MglB family)